MSDRMGRILYLSEHKGVLVYGIPSVILGTFCTGIMSLSLPGFRPSVTASAPGAKFKDSTLRLQGPGRKLSLTFRVHSTRWDNLGLPG